MRNGDPKTYAKAKALAATVDGGEPMAWKEYPNGSMVIIAQDGKKYTFQPDAKPEPEFTASHPPQSGTGWDDKAVVTEATEKLENVIAAVKKSKKKGK